MRLPLWGLLSALSLLACNKDRDGDAYTERSDCNDGDAQINPGEAEECDGIDNDCDGNVDEGLLLIWYADTDADGYGDSAAPTQACVQPSGYVDNDLDCKDTDADFFPGAPEDDCDDPDDYNCDGSVGYQDSDEDGVAACQGDCDDTRPDVRLGADEVCDEVDNDCDGDIDDNAEDASQWYIDYDADGYGADNYTLLSCSQPPGYVDNNSDCFDLSAAAFPGGEELCDGLDNDCDGTVDEDSPESQTYYADIDGDGFGDLDMPLAACDQPPGYVETSDDCDDTNAAVSPDADEVCDDLDNDCDTAVDEPSALDAVTWYVDGDGDGYGYSPAAQIACDQPSGYVDNNDDCDDGDADISPDVVEICDERDNDCDGLADESDATDAETFYADTDGDLFGDISATTLSCAPPSGYVADATDCDDGDAAINPDATEICSDGIDNNCDTGSTGCVLELPADHEASFYGEASGEGGFRFGHLDANADGYQDIAIGAGTQTNSGGSVNDGAAFLYLGPFSGDSALSDADVVITGRSTEKDVFGSDITGLGDFDGDGIDDLGITASQMDDTAGTGAVGALFVFSGTSLSSGTTLDATDADILLYGEGRQHYLSGLASGDFNNDGVSDVVLGASWAPDRSTREGTLYLVYGGLTAGGYDVGAVAQATFEGEDADDKLGTIGTLAVPGDVNGDGNADLLMGSYQHDTQSGAAYLALGPLTGNAVVGDVDVTLIPDDTGDYLGRSVGPAGDLNSDGYDDFLISAPWEDTIASSAGALFLFYGSSSIASLDGSVADSVATAILRGASSDDAVGTHFAADGDVDGDGIHDLLVGQPSAGTNQEGGVFFFYGPLSGTRSITEADAIFVGDTAQDEAGSALGFTGDISGSGTSGIIVDIPEDDQGTSNAGAAYIVLEFGL